MSTKRALQTELQQYRNAEALLALGARVPIVYEMTRLSSWFLRKLSFEILGVAPRKGQMPNSDQWYLRRHNNLQASLFSSLYETLSHLEDCAENPCHHLATAYKGFSHCIEAAGLESLMTIDRAWWLVKLMQIKNLKRSRCRICHARYIYAYNKIDQKFICWGCRTEPLMTLATMAPKRH